MSSMMRSTNGMQVATSVEVGLRLPGGRQKTVLVMKTLVRSRAIEASMRSSSRPLGPTNGRPWRSSSSPGASPIRTIRACGLPSPNTRLVAVLLSGQASNPASDGAQLVQRSGAVGRARRRCRRRGWAAGAPAGGGHGGGRRRRATGSRGSGAAVFGSGRISGAFAAGNGTCGGGAA